jgi:hypothetical protein
MEVWAPTPGVAGPGLEVRVKSPLGDQSVLVPRGGTWDSLTAGLAYAFGIAHGSSASLVSGKRTAALLSVAATSGDSSLGLAKDPAPCGIWEVELFNNGTSPLEVNAWIQRNDNVIAYPRRSRQSRFEDASYGELFDDRGRWIEVDSGASPVRREGMINGIATGSRTVVVGAFRRSDGTAAPYSAGGPLLSPPTGFPPADPRPDAMAVSDDYPAALGVRAAGTRTGSTVAMNGTSVATPQVTRAIAWLYATGMSGTSAERGAVQLAAWFLESIGFYPTPQPSLNRSGAGRLALPSFTLRVPR